MAWGYQSVTDATIRSLARVPVNFVAVKVRISNQFGTTPLMVGAASVGRSAGGAAIAGDSVFPLRFNRPT
jgi:hypothetical protein